MIRILAAALFCLLAGAAHACNVPNPNLLGPPHLVDNCPLPASVLNNLAPNYVTTVTNLRAASTAVYTSGVWRVGFTTSGDSPPLFFLPGTGVCGTDDGASCVNSSDSNHWTAQFPSTGLDVKWWGASNTGTDSTTAVQAAVNYACATNNGGGVILLGQGSYKFHDISVACGGITFRGVSVGATGFGGPAYSGTQVDCSSLTNFCIRYRPVGFPAAAQMDGATIEDITFNTSVRAGVILEMDQIRAPTVRRVAIWNALNGIKVFGSIHANLSDIQGWFITGVWIELTGDMSGPGCTLSACATRGDSAILNSIVAGDNGSSHTATGYYIHDQMFTVQTNDVQFEFGLYGYRVTCAAGQPNADYCPSILLNKGLNLEFATNPVQLTDATEFVCDQCYMAGQDTTNTINTFSTKLVNYSSIPGVLGGTNLTNSRIYGAADSCVLIGEPDSTLVGNMINQCNGSAGTYAAVEYAKAGSVINTSESHTLTANTLCLYLQSANTTSIGYMIDADASRVSATGNLFFSCSANELNNSNFPNAVYDSNSNPPDGPPTLSGATGLGASGSAAVSTGTDFYGQIQLTVAGASPAATGTVIMTFAHPHYPGMICTAMPMRGADQWNGRAIITNNTGGNTSTTYQFDWDNNSVALTTGGYYINYQCQKAG